MVKQYSIEINFEHKVDTAGYMDHDGCEGCKNEFTYPDLDKEPCLSCRQNHVDNHEREVGEDNQHNHFQSSS